MASMSQPDEVKLSGEGKEMEDDEYMVVFTDETKEIANMDNDKLIEHVHALERISKIARIRWKAAYIQMTDRIDSAAGEERDRLRKKDASYKPLNVPKETKAAKPRATGSTDDKARAALRILGLDEDAITKMLSAKKS